MKFKVLCFLLLAIPAFAGNWYVKKGATGTGAGTSWTNAWSEISSINFTSVACGDTVWLAAGAYTTTLSVTKTCTVGNVLTIQRVLATDSVPVAAAGWNAAFDGQVTGPAGWDIRGGAYITVDGRTVTGLSAGGASGLYGIKLTIPAGGGNGLTGAESGTLGHITLSHIELNGPACAQAGNCGTAAYGFNIAPSVNIVDNLLISFCSAHRMSETVRESQWQNSIVEHNSFYDMFNDGVDHEDVVYDYTFAPAGNVTWRYNWIFNSPNDGIFFEFGGAKNFNLYRNVFYASHVGFGTFKAPGTYGPINIVNNTFQSPDGPCSSNCSFYQTNGSTMTGCLVQNNVFYYVSNSLDGCTSNHNAYNYSSLGGFGWPSGETGSINTASSASFISVAGGDFHETSGSVTRNIGATLLSTFNTDMDGNVATAGSWDLGAYQFSSGVAPVLPPTSLTGLGNPTTVPLTWTNPQSYTANSVYRGTVPGGPYTVIFTSSGAVTTFTDASPLSVKSYYVVTGTNVTESAFSNEAAVTRPLVPPNCKVR